MMQSADQAGATELIGLLDEAGRLAGAAGRSDLAERLAMNRTQVASRQLRIVVIGTRGQGATSLFTVLRHTPPAQLPGVSVLDTPGGAGVPPIPRPGTTDAVLFVSEAGHEYSPAELDLVARLRSTGLPLVGVLTKIDIFPRWAEVQRANRARLQRAGLDSPSIPLLPVSAALDESGRQRGDEALTVSSGIPQLVDFIRDRLSAPVPPAVRDSVLGEIRMVVDQLSMSWSNELNSLRNPMSAQEIATHQQKAVAELERLRQGSVNWQLALADGATELMSEVDHDLRGRLREVMRAADDDISGGDPGKRWDEFSSWLNAQLENSLKANFKLALARSRKLAQQIAGHLEGPGGSIPLPEIRMPSPAEALKQVAPLQRPESKTSVLQQSIGSLRGSYSGILMVGMVASFIDKSLQLFNMYSLAAGVLMGMNQFWEDRKSSIERRKGEAKLSVSKLMDDVIFQVGDDSRAALRVVHRTLRDHFTKIGDEKLRAADNAVRAAVDAGQLQNGQRETMLAQVQGYLNDLRELRLRSAG